MNLENILYVAFRYLLMYEIFIRIKTILKDVIAEIWNSWKHQMIIIVYENFTKHNDMTLVHICENHTIIQMNKKAPKFLKLSPK